MKKYKNYYIDNVIFHSTEEIDEFLKTQAVDTYRRAVELFIENSTMNHSILCSEKADILVKQYGFTWEEVEALEIATMEAYN